MWWQLKCWVKFLFKCSRKEPHQTRLKKMTDWKHTTSQHWPSLNEVTGRIWLLPTRLQFNLKNTLDLWTWPISAICFTALYGWIFICVPKMGGVVKVRNFRDAALQYDDNVLFCVKEWAKQHFRNKTKKIKRDVCLFSILSHLYIFLLQQAVMCWFAMHWAIPICV